MLSPLDDPLHSISSLALRQMSPEIPNDLRAVFVVVFDLLKGHTLHESSIAGDGVDLEGIEFAALPSGYHQIDADVFSFAFKGDIALVRFAKQTSSVPGARGGVMWAVGVLFTVLASQSIPTYRHLPFLEQIDFVSDKPDESSALQIQTYFHQHQATPNANESKPFEVSHERPLDRLPDLISSLGPISIVLYKASLARRRILIYSPPPQRDATEMTCCLWAIGNCDGGESERADWLGSVGLFNMGDLDERTKSGRGWIGCTTDALFKERPHLYDLLLDISTSTPTLHSSTAVTSRPPASHRPIYKLSPTSYAMTDLALHSKLVDAFPEPLFHSSPSPSFFWSVGSSCFAGGLWAYDLAFGGGDGIHVAGAVRLEGEDTFASSTSLSPPIDFSPPPSLPLSSSLLRVFQTHARGLQRQIRFFSLRDAPSSDPVVLGARDLLSIGLSLSTQDVVLLRSLSDGKVDAAGFLLYLGRALNL